MVFTRRARRAATDELDHGDRRNTARCHLGWESRYVVRATDALDDYLFTPQQSSCVVQDLSTAGAGLVLDDPEVTVGDRLVIDLALTEHVRAASIRLHGIVRHATAQHDGPGEVRAGVEFVEVGDLERALLRRLVDARSR
jgi:PilZ domain